MKLRQVIQVNNKTYSGREGWNKIHYLETGNITENRFEKIQEFVVGKDTLPSRARRKVSQNSIVYSTVRPIQRHYGIIKKDLDNFLVSTGFAVIDVNEDMADADYIYFFLTQNSIVEKLQTIAEQSVSAYPSIRPSDLEELEIDLPDIESQRKIASILMSLTQKIDHNYAINDNLQQQTRAIFESWFIDNPDAEEWLNGKLSEFIVSMKNGDWGKESPVGESSHQVYCVRGADIPEVNVGNQGKMPTRYILSKNYTKKRLQGGDLVVEISGGSPTQSTGRVALITQSLLDRYDSGMVCTNFCKAITPIKGTSMYLYHYWQYLYDKGCFFLYENGTTGIKNLDINGFLESEDIRVPPIALVYKFEEFCSEVFSHIAHNALTNERLAELRDALMPRLMRGEIDVSAVDI